MKRMNRNCSMRFGFLALTVFLLCLMVTVDVESSVTGTQRVLVIPVEFDDVPHSKTIDEIEAWMEIVRDYFREVSMNQLELDIQMLSAWVPLGPRGDYMIGTVLDKIGIAIDAMYAADDYCSMNPDDCPLSRALQWADYSQDEGLGAASHPIIVVIYSGETVGREQGINLGAGWYWPEGYRYPIPRDEDDGSHDWRVGVAVVSETTESHFEDGSIIYETPKGVYAHEMLHAFGGPVMPNHMADDFGTIIGGKIGIADLYDDYTNFQELLGIDWIHDGADDFAAHWALMAGGTLNPPPPRGLSGTNVDPTILCTLSMADIGQYPSYPSSYTQIRLGWLDESDPAQLYRAEPPTEAGGVRIHTVVIRPLEVNPDLIACPVSDPDVVCTRILKIPIDHFDQVYYLAEVRKFEGSDQGLPDEGVIILTVDETKWSGMGIVRVVDDTEGTLPGCLMGPGPTVLNPLGDATWNVGQVYDAPDLPGLSITIDEYFGGDGSYRVTVTYPEVPRPDVAITDWAPPVYQTIDIWIDSDYANDFGETNPDADPVGNRDPLWLEHPNDIYAHIRNDGTADAHDVTVRFYWALFGAGQRDGWHFIGQDTDDVDAGGPGTDFVVRWDSPHAADLDEEGVSHFCIRVDIYSENDANPGNQAAQENIFSVQPASPIESRFLVFNPTNTDKLFYFQVDPKPPRFWNIELYPRSIHLGPGEYAPVDVSIVPPELFPPQTYHISVLTNLGDVLGPIGGVSYDVRIPEPVILELSLGAVNARSASVMGRIAPPRGRARITLIYTRPDDSSVERDVFSDADGTFRDRIVDPVPGTWSVLARWPGDLTHAKGVSEKIPIRIPRPRPFAWVRTLFFIVSVIAVATGAYYLFR